MTDQQLDDDHLHAWSSALNLELYDNDPGPREVRVGGPGEERTVNRHDYLVDLYARGLLVHVKADLDRLTAVAELARRNHARDSRRIFKRRPAAHLRAELIAAQLADTAAAIVRAAGADTDDKARLRLLAATRHQHTREVFDAFLGAGHLVGDPDDLIDELDRIDRGDTG